jgi:hypothetical protein
LEFFGGAHIEHFVPLHVVLEKEMDHIQINEAVVHKIKELQQQRECLGQQAFKEYTTTKMIRLDLGHVSEREKKYRIGECYGGAYTRMEQQLLDKAIFRWASSFFTYICTKYGFCEHV